MTIRAKLFALLDVGILLVFLAPLAVLVPLRMLVTYVWSWCHHRNSSSLKPLKLSPALSTSALNQAKLIISGETSSTQLVAEAQVACAEADQRLTAVCRWRPDGAAHAEAAAADAACRAGKAPLFAGVPCTVKECFAVRGMICQSSGIPARKSCEPATVDATLVARLRAAGLIPLLNTNTSELCMWYESSNTAWGRSRNAYSAYHGVGGSSGGEAALVSSGAVAVGVGSDIGGSIRMPAAFNGIYGHKPTGGLVPATGQHPSTPYPFLTTGPLCRAAADLWPMLRVMAGPDGQDPSCVPIPLRAVQLPLARPLAAGGTGGTAEASMGALPLPNGVQISPLAPITSWADITVYVLDVDAAPPAFSTHVQDDIRSALDRTAATLVRRIGCREVRTLVLPELAEGFDLWSAVLGDAPNNPTFVSLMEAAHGKRFGGLYMAWELAKWCVGATDATLPALILAQIEHLPKTLMPGRHRELLARVAALKQRLHVLLSSTPALLLMPTHPTTAPLHDLPLLRPFNVAYTALLNVLEVPVTVVPVGVDRSGLPIGLQVVGARGHDRLTIAAAEALEAVGAAGWTPPPWVQPAQ